MLKWTLLVLLLVTAARYSVTGESSSSFSSANRPMILRVRLPNGGMQRLLIPPGAEQTLSLSDALRQLEDELLPSNEPLEVVLGTPSTDRSAAKECLDGSRTIASLLLQHGSLLTLVTKHDKKADNPTNKNVKKYASSLVKKNRFDPFPDLAKDYASAMSQLKLKRRKATLSYGDLANLQSSLHVIEPQKEGPLKRVYMCRRAAESFFHTIHNNNNKQPSFCALLLGTIQTERNSIPPRTSLSSPTAPQVCRVAKVHAVWPSSDILQWNATSSVWRVAKHLGWQPIGWMCAYNNTNDTKSDKNDGTDWTTLKQDDLVVAAQLQIQMMQSLGPLDGSRFCTLIMHAETGSTEAFQVSDLTVQMVAEGVIANTPTNHDNDNTKNQLVFTQHPVLVDGKEVTQFDSVLCLVNTALLSHEGLFTSDSNKQNTVKKNGQMSNKTRKAILKLLNNDNDSNSDNLLFELLSDFQLLVALDRVLPQTHSEQLCQAVKRWIRGRKQSTTLDKKLKASMQQALELMQ